MEPNLERRMSKELTEKVELNTGLKSFKDIKSFDEFDFGKIDLLKGETPADIKEQCLKLCQDYVSGEWNEQTVDTIQVKRVSGGLTNQLYHCSISKPNPASEVPQEVAIRFYGPKYFDPVANEGNERLSDVVIATMVSRSKIGPHLYGVFEGGQIQKFYKHRQFLIPDQSNERIVKTVFQYLARIHSMEVPIKRNVDWLFKDQERVYREAYEKFPIDEEIEKYNCKTLKENNFKKELEWCWEQMKNANSPVVFTHNDFRSSNILICEPNDEVVICDFEYSAYGYRGYDLVNMMREWGRDQWDFKNMDDLPPQDSVFGPIIQIYVEECERIYGKQWSQNPINSVQHILNETKVFLLGACLFFSAFFMKMDENEPDSFPMARNLCMGWADSTFKSYFGIKEKLIKQNIIQ